MDVFKHGLVGSVVHDSGLEIPRRHAESPQIGDLVGGPCIVGGLLLVYGTTATE